MLILLPSLTMGWRRGPRPLLLRLLQTAARPSTAVPEALDAAEVRWAAETGLGSLLAHLLGDRLVRQPAAIVEAVRGAELWARVTTADRLDAVAALLDRCVDLDDPPTLLKGISVCQEFYPAAHLRPMSDVDILVEEAAIPHVEKGLLALGYRRESPKPPAFYETHHHTMPFAHPDTGVWIEVHRDLFPAEFATLAGDAVFSRSRVRAERRRVEFAGRPVHRLSPELQLLYLSTHWALDLRRLGGLVPILDVVYLLRARPRLDWGTIGSWLARSSAARSVHLLLSYVARHGLGPVPPEILSALAVAPGGLGWTERVVLHRLLDRHLLSARHPGRLSVRNARVAWSTLIGPERPEHGWLALPVRLLPRLRGRWRRA
jgi:hypothetical protein